MRFRNRYVAGQVLAGKLCAYKDRSDVLVLGLPRGGVVVAYEIARALNAPLDVLIVRKIGAPGCPELGIGAIASGGVELVQPGILSQVNASPEEVAEIVREERKELERRELLYRDQMPPLQLAGKTVILVDDGIATGSTMFAAMETVRRQQPRRIVAAVPVGAAGTCRKLREIVDEMICSCSPEDFHAIAEFYDDFTQLTDDEVRMLLARVARGVPSPF